MKKLKGSLLAKTAAIILLTATVLAFAVSALGVTFLAVLGVYPDSYQTGKDFALDSLCDTNTVVLSRRRRSNWL